MREILSKKYVKEVQNKDLKDKIKGKFINFLKFLKVQMMYFNFQKIIKLKIFYNLQNLLGKKIMKMYLYQINQKKKNQMLIEIILNKITIYYEISYCFF